MGRLWQTLILWHWKPALAHLRVETVIRDRQTDYYEVLSKADTLGDATPFVEFILSGLLDAVREARSTDQVGGLIRALSQKTLGASALMRELGVGPLERPNCREMGGVVAVLAYFVALSRPAGCSD